VILFTGKKETNLYVKKNECEFVTIDKLTTIKYKNWDSDYREDVLNKSNKVEKFE